MIACPQYSAEFNITDDMTVIDNGETNKRKNLPVILKEKPKRTIKVQIIIYIDHMNENLLCILEAKKSQ